MKGTYMFFLRFFLRFAINFESPASPHIHLYRNILSQLRVYSNNINSLLCDIIPNIHFMENHSEKIKPAIPVVFFKEETIKATSCIHQLLGNTIDFKWNIKNAVMEVSPSKSDHF